MNLALGHYNRFRVDVQLVQVPIRVVPSAVRVVGPGRVSDPAKERQPRVVAVVDSVAGVVRV